MTIYYAVIAVLILLAVFLVRGLKYALGALLVLVALYAAFAWWATVSMG